jgi:hypothetical protein
MTRVNWWLSDPFFYNWAYRSHIKISLEFGINFKIIEQNNNKSNNFGYTFYNLWKYQL